jgi:ABC-2 type transport system permease protein
MNWLSIFRFEFRYRQNRPATYLFFGGLLVLSFALVSTDLLQSLTTGTVRANAPIVLARASLFLFLLLGVPLSSAIMGLSVVRDITQRTDSLFFTKPIRRWEFLTGRYLSCMLLLLATLLAVPLGLMLGDIAPWRNNGLLPFRAIPYWYAYGTLLVPNALIVGSIFFAVGALSRRATVVVVQGVILLVLYSVSGTLLSPMIQGDTAALLDPFGLRALSRLTQNWSIVQQNDQLVGVTATLLLNRLVWFGVAGLALVMTYIFFSRQYTPASSFLTRQAAAGLGKRRARPSAVAMRLPLQRVNRAFNTWAWIGNLGHLTLFYVKVVVRDIPFRAVSIGGLGLLGYYTLNNTDDLYRVSALPMTCVVLDKMGPLTGLFLFALMMTYTGDLVWKERDLRIDRIGNALPVPAWVPLLSKQLGLGLILGLMLGLIVGLAALLQTVLGATNLIDWPVYTASLYGGTLLNLLAFMSLGFFIHTLVNDKFTGHALLALFFVLLSLLPQWGIGSLLPVNQSGFGQYVAPFSWIGLSNVVSGAILFGGAVLLAMQGSEQVLRLRQQLANHQLTRSLLMVCLTLLIVFLPGGLVYYSGNYPDNYQSRKADDRNQADQQRADQGHNYPAGTNQHDPIGRSNMGYRQRAITS